MLPPPNNTRKEEKRAINGNRNWKKRRIPLAALSHLIVFFALSISAFRVCISRATPLIAPKDNQPCKQLAGLPRTEPRCGVARARFTGRSADASVARQFCNKCLTELLDNMEIDRSCLPVRLFAWVGFLPHLTTGALGSTRSTLVGSGEVGAGVGPRPSAAGSPR